MPGLAASSSIFENIQLPEDVFEVFLLEWFIPKDKESLGDYAFRMTKEIKHENPVLIGVSFGGILVQEMSLHIQTRKVIIVSSVKTSLEMPKRMSFAKITKIYKLFPTKLLANIDWLTRIAFGKTVRKKVALYERYLKQRDKKYLDWAIESVILWSRTESLPNVVHIHGDKDEIFPINNIKNCIVVQGGTHIMIINKYKWFNENLPKLILNNSV